MTEDSPPSISKMMIHMLTHAGHEIEHAENGAIAGDIFERSIVTSRIAMWVSSSDIIIENMSNLGHSLSQTTSSQYDIIFMDMQMPIMDGLEAIRRTREMESKLGKLYQPITIIGVSANSDEETRSIRILSYGNQCIYSETIQNVSI
jgi:CheY-like chemotaxis protein